MQERTEISNEEIINLTINEPSWEDVIVKIVSEYGIDPWNIDLVALADAFILWLETSEQINDLRVSARFILIAAILLRMKSDVLAEKREHILVPEGPEKERDAELLRLLATIPPLQPPLKRVTFASVTLPELITALRKAFEVQERRKIRRERLRIAIKDVLPKEKDDINERIAQLIEVINQTIEQVENLTTFKKIVSTWERRHIVRTLVPLLHLSQDGKIEYEQPVLFEDIIIRLRKKEDS